MVQGQWSMNGQNTLLYNNATWQLSESFEVKVNISEFSLNFQIPKGIQCNGIELKDDFSFSFSTPTVSVKKYIVPASNTPLNTLFFVSFNQAINPAEIVSKMRILNKY